MASTHPAPSATHPALRLLCVAVGSALLVVGLAAATLLAEASSSSASNKEAAGLAGIAPAAEPLQATETPTVTPAQSPTPTATVTPTATLADLVLTGFVRSVGGSQEPIVGALVRALLCVPRAFQATTDEEGRYDLTIPADYAVTCSEITLEVSAEGYRTLTQSYTVADLHAQPQRDFALAEEPREHLWLPVMLKGSPR